MCGCLRDYYQHKREVVYKNVLLPAGWGSWKHQSRRELLSMTGIVSSANHQRPGQRIVFEDGDRPGMESTARPSSLSLSLSLFLSFLVFLSSPV